MAAATVFIVSKTAESLKIMEEVVKCALIEDCMGPPKSKIKCATSSLRIKEYANCH
ncbi:hypothetical protein FO519_010934, partial [Halicephalobus sp. NKZ332]